jgi:hypothetical protein
MLRLKVLPAELEKGKASAVLVDDDGAVVAEGHLVSAAEATDVVPGSKIETGLRFIGEGLLPHPAAGV